LGLSAADSGDGQVLAQPPQRLLGGGGHGDQCGGTLRHNKEFINRAILVKSILLDPHPSSNKDFINPEILITSM
jgi:hypothetical protein